MAQLWLTYDELGQELGCEATAARDTAISSHWTRKRSHDGQTRVLLPQHLMQAYCIAHAQTAASAVASVARPVADQLRRMTAGAGPVALPTLS